MGIIFFFGLVLPAAADAERWMVDSGDAAFHLDTAALEALGITIDFTRDPGGQSSSSMISLTIQGGFPLDVEVENGALDAVWRGEFPTGTGMVIQSPKGFIRIEEVAIRPFLVGQVAEVAIIDGAGNLREPLLELEGAKLGFDVARKVLLWEAAGTIITPSLAHLLSDPLLAGVSVGAMRGRAFLAVSEPEPAAVGLAGESPMTSPPALQPVHPSSRGGTGGTSCWDPGEPLIGPDVIVGEFIDICNYAAEGDYDSFAVGTTSCNIGSTNLLWRDNTPQVPVIGQNMFRLKNGRFEQIGQGWLKYAFTALTQNVCGCGCNGQGGTVLGIGCSDPYWCSLNGNQSNLGPKYQVNAYTGAHPSFPANPPFSGSVARRVRVLISDLDPAQNPGALYFVEGHYVTPDDAAAGNHFNNASYRQIRPYSGGEIPTPFFIGPAQREKPAIRAWKANDPSVTESDIRLPDEGLLILASKATDLGGGWYHYEYALQNLNSDRSVGSFSIPLGPAITMQNIGFHDVEYHSGEIQDNTDWTATVTSTTITWETTPFDVNPSANALRWGSLYNFRFDANAQPGPVTATLGLFKPGTLGTVTGATTGPVQVVSDCNENALADFCDLDCGPAGGICDVPGCGASLDCDGNRIPDECETDCNHNGRLDSCDLDLGISIDCNRNQIPDECETDCNRNGQADSCDLELGVSTDCNRNRVPDDCEPDCDDDGITDDCDGSDADGDGIIDCDDLCPSTSPPGSCTCPPTGRCCWPVGICLPEYDPTQCILDGGTPDCFGSPCREGCLLGDADGDGDRDLRDVAALANCYSGPAGMGVPTPLADCRFAFDLDSDEDVDAADYGEIHVLIEGPAAGQ
jgi:hypothetical protein